MFLESFKSISRFQKKEPEIGPKPNQPEITPPNAPEGSPLPLPDRERLPEFPTINEPEVYPEKKEY